jgi:hypothetical protein
MPFHARITPEELAASRMLTVLWFRLTFLTSHLALPLIA